MPYITLTNGNKTLVDNESYALFSDIKWAYSGGYVLYDQRSKGARKKIWLHRLIANTPDGMVTDHINGNKLDNRKSNLRVCTRQQNNINVGLNKANTSGYKGVAWHKRNKKWRAIIKYNKKSIWLGLYDTKEEAAIAYNKAAVKYFGEYAFINVVESLPRTP